MTVTEAERTLELPRESNAVEDARRFAEHVVAPRRGLTRLAQRVLRRPWAWTFEGCSCERDLEAAIRSAGFAHVELEHSRISSPFLPFNTHIAGIATA